MATSERPRRDRPRQAQRVRLPGRRGGRRDAERRPRRDGRQARPLPRDGRRPAASRRRARRRAPATAERYVREWLNAQAAGGYVEYDPGTRPLHAAARAGDRADRRRQPGVPAAASSRSRSASVRDAPRITEAGARPATASAGTSTTTTCSTAASGSSAPATTRTSSPAGCRRSTASSAKLEARRAASPTSAAGTARRRS